jgi:hypothetical protein
VAARRRAGISPFPARRPVAADIEIPVPAAA